jgi:hypothetical protein
MSQSWIGKCISQKTRNGKITQLSRIIDVNVEHDLVVCIPFPRVIGNRIDNYVPAPRFMSAVALARELEDDENCTLVDFKVPEQWLWIDKQIDANSVGGVLRRHRRKLRKWKEVRDQSYDLIKPLVEGRQLREILNDKGLTIWPLERAQELGLNSSARIKRALNAYLFGLGDKRALLPGYSNCGAPGQQKFSTKDTGRPNIEARKLGTKKNSPMLSPDTRARLALGWRRHKAKGVSDRVALARTLYDYFVKSIPLKRKNVAVELRPEAYDISLKMFRYWGTKGPQTLRSSELNQGLSPARDEVRRRMNKAADRYDTLNGVAYIDSTPTDQTLVSSIYPLKRLETPWRTEVLGASVDYIFGIYVGFEAVSATTSLLAILNAAADKVAFCARFGHTIGPRDWYGSTFSTFKADNGEAKGKLAMYTLEALSQSANYGKVYDAINKASSESGHNQRQKNLDHLLPGSTMGRPKLRGEKDRVALAGLRFDDYMHLLIAEILHHNNVAYIDPPRLEMYPAIEDRTRRGVVEWLMKHHYLSSSPLDIDVLRVMCLPRFDAVIHADGIHLFVPGSGGQSLIGKLVYRNDYLHTQGVLHQSRRKAIKLEVHMNPTDLTHIWANIDGLKRLNLAAGDLDFAGISLIDWLAISEDDRLARFLSQKAEMRHLVNQAANVDHLYQEGRKARQEAIQTHGKPTKKQMRSDVSAATEIEKALVTGVPSKRLAPMGSGVEGPPEKTSPSIPPPGPDTPNLSNDLWLDIAAQVYEANLRGMHE